MPKEHIWVPLDSIRYPGPTSIVLNIYEGKLLTTYEIFTNFLKKIQNIFK